MTGRIISAMALSSGDRVLMCPRNIRVLFMAILLLPVSGRLSAGDVLVAVAANFTDAARSIAPLFEQASGHRIRISYGSTGKLYAQIEHGAPFHVFLAADSRRPQLAEQQGLAVVGSRFVYARGKLVLWSAQADAFGQGETYLRQARFRHLAMANPKTAPYGLAARQVMQRLGVWSSLQDQLVRGDSIAQTFQFVATGNAQAGFVACSQLSSWQGEAGSVWKIPQDYYAPIEQAAVLLKKGADNPAAIAFMAFLNSEPARAVIRDYGYEVPGEKVSEKKENANERE
jgi:molybdate transport system substrate-binding protein